MLENFANKLYFFQELLEFKQLNLTLDTVLCLIPRHLQNCFGVCLFGEKLRHLFNCFVKCLYNDDDDNDDDDDDDNFF